MPMPSKYSKQRVRRTSFAVQFSIISLLVFIGLSCNTPVSASSSSSSSSSSAGSVPSSAAATPNASPSAYAVHPQHKESVHIVPKFDPRLQANLPQHLPQIPYYYDYERDPRQWYGSGYNYPPPMANDFLYGLTSGYEALLFGAVILFGLGIVGIPLLLLICSWFNIGLPSGLNYLNPTSTTTTVTGRKRRSPIDQNSLFAMHPFLRDKLAKVFERYLKSEENFN